MDDELLKEVTRWYKAFSKKKFSEDMPPFANVVCCSLSEDQVYRLTKVFGRMKEYLEKSNIQCKDCFWYDTEEKICKNVRPQFRELVNMTTVEPNNTCLCHKKRTTENERL